MLKWCIDILKRVLNIKDKGDKPPKPLITDSNEYEIEANCPYKIG